jgi:hypothetical protein
VHNSLSIPCGWLEHSEPSADSWYVGRSARLLVGVGLAGLLLGWGSGRASAAPQPKVSICHRTASVKNPYTLLTTDGDSIIKQGHGSHIGPVFPGTGPDGKWGDIIPPFDYSGGHYPGLNWDSDHGQEVWNAGCQVDIIPEPPEETTTTVPSTSTTAPPPSTTTSPTTSTTSPPVSTTSPPVSTTSLPPSTTSPTVPPTTPTTSPEAPPPGPTDPPGGQEETPPQEAVVIDPGNQTNTIGTLDDAERTELESELDVAAGQPSLAETGSPYVGELAFAAFMLILIGLMVLALSRLHGYGETSGSGKSLE